MAKPYSLPVRLFCGVMVGAVVAALIISQWPPPKSTPPDVTPPVALTPDPPAIDVQAVRERAWQAVTPRIEQAERESAAEIDAAVQIVRDFLAKHRTGVPKFTAAILSLKGKWKLIYAHIPLIGSGTDSHIQFLNQQFGDHVFKMETLQQTAKSAADAYVGAVRGIDNQLLVKIRADIAAAHPAAGAVFPALDNQERWNGMFHKVQQATATQLSREVGVDVAYLVSLFVATDVVTNVVVQRLGVTVAATLGVDAGILGAGAASSWATFGTGLVVAILVDMTLDWLLKLAGLDQESRVTDKVNSTLDRLEQSLIEGEPKSVALYKKFLEKADTASSESVRTKCRAAAKAIETSGALGLRYELQKIHDLSARLRRESLQQFILNDERK